MTTPQPPANPCGHCGDGEALFSLMSLHDYSQVKLCPACAPKVLRGIADDMDGAYEAAGTADAVAGTAELAGQPPAPDGTATGQAPEADPEPAAPPPARRKRTAAGGAQ